MNGPDVSVIVPVHNTRPYLRRCLDSLVRQTIGAHRMEIVAVDDGSTDGSGAELDRFAARHPGVVSVVHQAPSGGPAAPCNRGLDRATGRYVFFVGADDWLGADALRRLVAAADRLGSDVVLGKVVGVNSRHIHQDVFARDRDDIDLSEPALARSLGNTKLFRRALIEHHGLRYREDLPIASDQPFTLAACHRAGRVSVLADYEYYYAVRRLTATNITYLSRPLDRLRVAEELTAYAAGLLPPGPRREAVLAHYFDHNVGKLIEDDLLRVDRDTQQRIRDGVARLAAGHLTDAIAARLGAETRVRAAVARDGVLDDLLAVIRQDALVGVPPTVVDGGRRFAGYPGFRAPAGRLPDACFDVTAAADWPAKLDATTVAWESGRTLVITARTPRPGADGLAARAEDVPAEVRVVDAGPDGTTVQIRLAVPDLVDASVATGRRRIVAAYDRTSAHRTSAHRASAHRASAGGATTDAASADGAAHDGASGAAAVRAPGIGGARPLLARRGVHVYAVRPVVDGSGRLMVSVVPVTARRVLARLRQSGRLPGKWTKR